MTNSISIVSSEISYEGDVFLGGVEIMNQTCGMSIGSRAGYDQSWTSSILVGASQITVPNNVVYNTGWTSILKFYASKIILHGRLHAISYTTHSETQSILLLDPTDGDCIIQ